MYESPPVAIEHPLVVDLSDGEEATQWSDVPTGVAVGLDTGGEGGVE
jgi:hypothetical protein